MIYLVDETKYHMSYQELKRHYLEILEYTDEQFLMNLPMIIHLSCMIGYLKEFDREMSLSDKGLIHQLAHLLHLSPYTNLDVQEVRESFKLLCNLV